MLVGDDIEGNEDDDGEENWGSVGEDVAEDVGDEEVGDVENSEEDGDEVRQTIDSILQMFETGSLIQQGLLGNGRTNLTFLKVVDEKLQALSAEKQDFFSCNWLQWQIWFHPSEPLKGKLKVKSDST